VVRTLDIDEVREIYELRITLEPIMVRRVAKRITAEQFDRAEELATKMQSETDLSAWVDLNRDFHAVFCEPDSKSKLAGILATLRDSASVYVALSLKARPQQVPEANVELIRLYRKRDTETIEGLTLEHLRSTLSAIEAAHDRGVL
jgi:DNA-binding GntR family transcriptional regulator